MPLHVSVIKDELDRITNIEVLPNGCLFAPYYGHLYPDQIYSVLTSATSQSPHPPSVEAFIFPLPSLNHTGDSVNTAQAVPPGLTPRLEIVLILVIKILEVEGSNNLNFMKMSALWTIILSV
jgi:hypothetical protein